MENNLLNRPYLLTLLMAGLIAIVAVVLPIINDLVDGSSKAVHKTEIIEIEKMADAADTNPDPAVPLFP
jgi:hypothetical protein